MFCSFCVSSSPLLSRIFQVATGVLDLEHTITDVIEGKEYLFSVTACNKCGPGEPAYIDEPVNVSSPASEYLCRPSESDSLRVHCIRSELKHKVFL